MKSRRIVTLASLVGMLALTACGTEAEDPEMGAESGAETAPSVVTEPAPGSTPDLTDTEVQAAPDTAQP